MRRTAIAVGAICTLVVPVLLVLPVGSGHADNGQTTSLTQPLTPDEQQTQTEDPIVILTDAIKELRERVVDLENRVCELEGEQCQSGG